MKIYYGGGYAEFTARPECHCPDGCDVMVSFWDNVLNSGPNTKTFKWTKEIERHRRKQRRMARQNKNGRTLPDDSEINCNSLFYDSGSFNLRKRSWDYAKEHRGDWKGFYDTDEFWEYMESYAAYILKNKSGIDIHANIDVIPDPELSWRNLKWLEAKGLNPLPVIHLGTSVKWLHRHLDEGYDFIGLGGLVASGGIGNNSYARKWCDRMFETICDTNDRTPSIKVHGFGLTGAIARVYPWYSVDSTRWVMVGSFGALLVPRKTKGVYNFDLKPREVSVTVEGLGANMQMNRVHISHLKRRERELFDEWLDFIKVPLGVSKGEEVIEEGVTNNRRMRILAGIRYFEHFKASLPEWPWPWKSKRGKGFGLC